MAGRKSGDRKREEWVFEGDSWVPKSGRRGRQIRSYRDLDVFNLGYALALWNNEHVNRPTLWNTSYSVELSPFNKACSTGLAMEVFRLTARFPKEERYALVDQMRRSSRSVCGNIACPAL